MYFSSYTYRDNNIPKTPASDSQTLTGPGHIQVFYNSVYVYIWASNPAALPRETSSSFS
jgi:hypothetical protein